MIFIETYSAKSFVVRGDTTPFKDNLKDMGGKWNSKLTDKKTNEKFGAWLFWSDKRDELTKWVESLNNGNQQKSQGKDKETLSNMELMLKELVLSLDSEVKNSLTRTPLYNKLFSKIKQDLDEDIVEDSDEEIVEHKRLLK